MEQNSVFYGALTFPLALMVHAFRQWPTHEAIALIAWAVRIRVACAVIVPATILSYVALRLGDDVPTSMSMGLLAAAIALAIGVLITKLLDSMKTPLVWGVCEKITRIVASDKLFDSRRQSLDSISNFRLKGNRESWQQTIRILHDVLYPSSQPNPASRARRTDAYQCVMPFLIAPILFLAIAIGLFCLPGSENILQYLEWLAGSIPIAAICSWVIGIAIAR